MATSSERLLGELVPVQMFRATLARVCILLGCFRKIDTWLTSTCKGIETVQQSVFGQGNQSASEESGTGEDQSHHAAVDQAHPEEISEYLRDKHMSTTKEEREGSRLG